jgi:hypothetical protein
MLNKRTTPLHKYYKRYGVDLWGRIRHRIRTIIARHKFRLEFRLANKENFSIQRLSKHNENAISTPLPRFLLNYVKSALPPRYWFNVITRFRPRLSRTTKQKRRIINRFSKRLERRKIKRRKSKAVKKRRKMIGDRSKLVLSSTHIFRYVLRLRRRRKALKRRIRKLTWNKPKAHPLCKVIPWFDPNRRRRTKRHTQKRNLTQAEINRNAKLDRIRDIERSLRRLGGGANSI